MLSCVLVTPIFAECGREAGIFTSALAELMLRSGHQVEIVCSHADAPRPGHEEHGRMRVHRLHAKRQNLDASFCAAGVRRIDELRRSGRCDRVIAVDCPMLPVMLNLTGATYGRSCPIHTIDVSELGEEESVPLFEGLWSPPAINRPTVLGLETDDAQRKQLISAFRAGQAGRDGWSLKLLDPDGTWSTIEHGHADSSTDEALIVPMRPGPSIVARLAHSHGITSIPYSCHAGDTLKLQQELDQAIGVPADIRRELARNRWASDQHEANRRLAKCHWENILMEQPGVLVERQLDQWRSSELHGKCALRAGGAA